MTLAGLKLHLKTILNGNKELPKDEDLKPLLKECLISIALRCEPLALLVFTDEEKVLKYLQDLDLYLRMPRVPKNDTDKLDLDTELCFALSYMLGMKLSNNESLVKYIAQADEICSDYIWNRFNNIKSNDDIKKYIPRAIYTKKLKTIKGYKYFFDNDFISKLNDYLKGEAIDLTNSDIKNIDKLLAYESEIIDNKANRDNEALDEFCKYLGGL